MARTTLAILLTLALLAAGSPARADDEPACTAPSTLTRAGFRLAFLAASLKEHEATRILVLNSAAKASPAKSPAGKADEGIARSFPSYVEEVLRARYPEGSVEVTIRNEPRRTAESIVEVLPALLAQVRPVLVIWQTGTHDAIRGADLDGFGNAVATGIGLVHAADADVIIVTPQYSPRTDFAFDVAPYVSTLRWVARSNGAPLFDRYALMRYWDDESVFDFDSLRPAPTLFNNVHRCIGRLLVRMIADGVDIRTSGSH